MLYRTPSEIVAAAARVTGSSIQFIQRKRHRVDERMRVVAAVAVVGRARGMSHQTIANALGFNDHTSVYHHLVARGDRPDVKALALRIERYLLKPTWRDQYRLESAEVAHA